MQRFYVAGWAIQRENRPHGEYWRASRDGCSRGAPTPTALRKNCEPSAPSHKAPTRHAYAQFLAQRAVVPPAVGFEVADHDLHPSLFPFQRHAIQLACARGRAALFEDTGLGKSRQILEWMRLVTAHTSGRCLLITPLAVAHQFVRDEAPALGLDLAYARSQAEADASGCALVVTNYDCVDQFDGAAWSGMALDEADIIANMVGATNRQLTAMFAATLFKLVATATPASVDGACRVKQSMQVLTSQATNDWYTPPHIIERARRALGGSIDLDPASCDVAQQWIQARIYYTADELMSGLARPWEGRVWLNPPFDDTPTWVAHLERMYVFGEIETAVLLVNTAPGYVWWEELWRQRPVVMLRERLRFLRADGSEGGQAKKAQTVAYYGVNVCGFIKAFSDLGRVILP